MSDGATASAATYTKVSAGLLDACARADPAAPRRWRLAVPGHTPAPDCTYVWLQARCTAVAPVARHRAATLDDSTGAPVFVLCTDDDTRFAPGRYLMVLGRLIRSAAFGSSWVIRPHKVVGLRCSPRPLLLFSPFLFLHHHIPTPCPLEPTDLTETRHQRLELWKTELQDAYPVTADGNEGHNDETAADATDHPITSPALSSIEFEKRL